jgi:2-phospho-L-lactate/phosphoenolpyruvate guanylyltransferase
MSAVRGIGAVVPVKETSKAKERLAPMLTPARRQQLACAMLEDVLGALAATAELASILVVTVDPAAALIAARYGAQVCAQNAAEGHSAAVAGAARRLAAKRLDMLTVPADIPLVRPGDIHELLACCRTARSASGQAFCIVPAHDQRGSNAVACSPADAVPLRFGEDSFLPHLAAARERGIEPVVLRLPRIALDIDTPEDLARCIAAGSSDTRTLHLLRRWHLHAVNSSVRLDAAPP